MERNPYEVGTRFGRLLVVGSSVVVFDEKVKRNRYYYPCVCDCGNERPFRKDRLAEGKTQSCGCLANELSAERLRALQAEGVMDATRLKPTHGYCKHRTYRIWRGMRDRCYREKHKGYHRYGGRGITVCEEWHSFPLFLEWALLNGYDKSLQIDRRDNDKGYSPDNCRWVTPKVNMRNTHRAVWLEAFGQRRKLVEWVDDSRCVVSEPRLRYRIRRGWNPEEAIVTPYTPPSTL